MNDAAGYPGWLVVAAGLWQHDLEVLAAGLAFLLAWQALGRLPLLR